MPMKRSLLGALALVAALASVGRPTPTLSQTAGLPVCATIADATHPGRCTDPACAGITDTFLSGACADTLYDLRVHETARHLARGTPGPRNGSLAAACEAEDAVIKENAAQHTSYATIARRCHELQDALARAHQPPGKR
jgi:hypothetical protein